MHWLILFILFAAFTLGLQDADASTFDTVTAHSDVWAHPVVIMVALVLLVVVSHVAALWWASGTIKEPTYKIVPGLDSWNDIDWKLKKRSRLGRWRTIYSSYSKSSALMHLELLSKEPLQFTRQGIPYKKIP